MTSAEQLLSEHDDRVAAVEAKLRNERAAHAATRRHADRLESEIAELRQVTSRYAAVHAQDLVVPSWMASKPKVARQHRGTGLLLLSDLHLDEVVDVAVMSGINEYNRKIAKTRLVNLVENVAKLATHYVSGVKWDGLVVGLNGDILSGDIHDELARENEAPIAESVRVWTPLLAAALARLADTFGKIHVVCTDGNHDRNYKKLPAKRRHESSFAWIVYNWVADILRADKRITFQISPASSQVFPIYGTMFHQVHGDGFRSAGGVGGIYPSMLKYLHRQTEMWANQGVNVDVHLLGHWHTYLTGPNFIVNGCFPADMRVHTPNGPEPIAKIEVGDTVLSRDGSWQSVTHKFERSADQGLVKLKVRGLPALFEATPNHLVWAVKGTSVSHVEPKWRHHIDDVIDEPGWIPAGMVSPGDWVHVPFPTGDERTLTEDEARLVGLFLAEGHTLLGGGSTKKHHRLGLSMHRREVDLLERAHDIIETMTGRRGIISTPEKRPNSAELVVTVPREVAAEWHSRYGHGAHHKRIPAEFYVLAPDLKAAVIDGWVTGDGHTRADGVTSATTVSPDLAWGMFHLALAAGMRPSLATLPAGGPRKSDSYTVHFNSGQESREVNGEIFYRVQHRFRSGDIEAVYDLEVEGEHTYVVEGVGVHNSLKGYDEYARHNGFRPEPPRQAFAVVTPERGIAHNMPVYCD